MLFLFFIITDNNAIAYNDGRKRESERRSTYSNDDREATKKSDFAK